ncbi:MAG: hypothetical protein OEU92_14710 [Alphaproteobacteria bacterium]|nr:hypothetical protein [Alphaproteobacteria bacterium]
MTPEIAAEPALLLTHANVIKEILQRLILPETMFGQSLPSPNLNLMVLPDLHR